MHWACAICSIAAVVMSIVSQLCGFLVTVKSLKISCLVIGLVVHFALPMLLLLLLVAPEDPLHVLCTSNVGLLELFLCDHLSSSCLSFASLYAWTCCLKLCILVYSCFCISGKTIIGK